MKEYFGKWKGSHKRHHKFNGYMDVFFSWLGSFVGIGLCAYLSSFWFEENDLILIVGSFGASAVLLYAANSSPLSQPRNCIGGHVISAIIGVFCYKTVGAMLWIAAPLAVSIAIAIMLVTDTVHPPGGATALIAVIGSSTIHDLGYLYVFLPVGLGAVILVFVALVVNNLSSERSYPQYWL